ncbi:hypothetical protein [Streptomyces sp. NBC_00687]|uniref:hypothetical protein n=1 Tax=Streptomyces sp. NBC_00687 TaxID=2975807 RepID=UPI0022537B13|nr:hypothetical protein [Streptomyces sp. NBC_00687]MCX4920284.1 hypothetical protein [Streptomyces sp. NBC_00687]
MTTPQNPQPLLSLHSAVVLMIAFVVGAVMAVLTFLTGAPLAAAVAGGITSAGMSIPSLHTNIQ